MVRPGDAGWTTTVCVGRLARRQEDQERAPKKVFHESDFYTIRLDDGSRNLVIENTLAEIEGQFVRIRDATLRNTAVINAQDHTLLSLFCAALSVRGKRERENLTESFEKVRDMTSALEQQYLGAPAEGTAEIERYVDQGHQLSIGHNIQSVAKWLIVMNLVILTSAGAARFITSDKPVVRYNQSGKKSRRCYAAA